MNTKLIGILKTRKTAQIRVVRSMGVNAGCKIPRNVKERERRSWMSGYRLLEQTGVAQMFAKNLSVQTLTLTSQDQESCGPLEA